MKRITIILFLLFLLLSVTLNATTYWVTPRGNDTNDGLDSASTGAWKTWRKAFATANEGDTVFIRGGTYLVSSTNDYGAVANSGTAENPICFWAYPADYAAGNIPTLDFSSYNPSPWTYAIRIYSRSYIKFKGLTIKNLLQYSSSTGYISGIVTYQSNHIYFENMAVHNIGGPCYDVGECDNIFYKNCDASGSVDSYATVPGGNGSGFAGSAIYEGCRAWGNGDQGFACAGNKYVEFNNCWSFDNGRMQGEGYGFKYSMGSRTDTTLLLARTIKNCISALNAAGGTNPNNVGGTPFNGHYFNNFIYRNGYKPYPYSEYPYIGCGIWICSGFSYLAPNELWANNISYANERGSVVNHGVYTHEYNSWDQPGVFTITDDDFVSLDTLQLWYPRKSDGSLPDITFGTLKPTSDLIDAGIDSIITRDYAIGLDFTGVTSDLGWAEYGDVEIDSTATNILSFTFALQTGAAVIDTTNHTVAIEVYFTADITNLIPTITMSYGATISPLSGVSQNFTNPVVYTVTALDGATEQEWTVTVTETTAVTSITVSGAGGATTITTEGGTLQMSAAVLPNDADNKDVTWSVINGTGQGTINLGGLLTATADGTVTVRATADDGSAVYDDQVIVITGQSGLVPSSKTVKYRGKIVKR